VPQSGLHLPYLVGHALAEVKGEGDAQGAPLAAEERDLPALAVLRDLEVLAPQPQHGLTALVHDRDGDPHRARGGRERRLVGIAGRGGEGGPARGGSGRRSGRRGGWRALGGSRPAHGHDQGLAGPRLAQRGVAVGVQGLAEAAAPQLGQYRVLADPRAKEPHDVRGLERGVAPGALRARDQEQDGRDPGEGRAPFVTAMVR
jgi:hypothetical protein